MLILSAMFGLTMTYAIIPTFLPALAGTPAAWAYTTLGTVVFMIFSIILIFIISRNTDD
jgi:uncharacterized membrane protein